jgi:putative polyhydroxyalkanoate system protein
VSVIRINRKHNMPLDQARQQVREVVDKLQRKIAADYTWNRDTVSFKRSGASGRIKVDDRQIDVEVKLGLVLSPMRSSVEKAINDYLDENLA